MRFHSGSVVAVVAVLVVVGGCGSGSTGGPGTSASDAGDASSTNLGAGDGGGGSSGNVDASLDSGGGVDTCAENASCAPGFCLHEAGKAGSCSDGKLYCYADDQCVSGRCNVKMPGNVSQCTNGADKDPCTEASDCKSGTCIPSAFGMVCSSGLPGSPCGVKADCGANECNNNYCFVLRGVGGQCYGPNACKPGLSCVQFNIATFGACTDGKLGSPCSLLNECTEGVCNGATGVSLGTCQ